MKIRNVFLLLIFSFVISKPIIPQTNNKNTIKGWEKKQHIVKHYNKTITKSEIKSISNKLNKILLNNALNKKTENNQSIIKLLIKSGKPYLVNTKNELQGLKIHWSKKRNTPTNISGFDKNIKLTKTQNIKASETALSFIEKNKELFRLKNPKQELIVQKTLKDKLGKTHVKFTQQYRGIPFWNGEIVVHTNPNGNIYYINAQYYKTPFGIDLKYRISNKQAILIAKQNLETKIPITKLDAETKKFLHYRDITATKYIWYDNNNKNHLVWHVQIRPNIRDNWYYFIDAKTGEILEHYNATNFDGPLTATATDLNGIKQTIHVYNDNGKSYMIDASRDMWQNGQTDILNDPKGAILTIDARQKDLTKDTKLYHVTTTTSEWNDPVSVSAHYNAGIVYEYYKNTHGRNSIDNQGSTILSVIHVTDNGESMANAYWNGAFMIYGDGGNSFLPLAGALDVSGHEMTHGVIQHTVALEYKFQSGALNESLADVFGAMVDKDNWLLGEDVTKTSFIPSGALRNMEDPHNGGTSINDPGWQPANMDEYVNLTIDQDNGGVHINSGIPNHACALIGNAIGKEKTENIYYRILNEKYLNTKSQFIDMRLALIRAASDLYGENSTEVDAVKQAFDTVGILDGNGTKPPEDLPPVNGDEWIAAVNAENNDNSLFLIKPVINNNNTDIIQISTTQVFTNTGNPITVSDNGKVILFIDSHNFIRAINSDGTNETIISKDSVWKSISLSPDGTKLAATTYWEDGLIYVFDLNNSANSKEIKLYNPTTQEGVKDSVVKYADALDWDLSSKFIVYDSFNKVPKASGDIIAFWTVNILDVDNEKIYSVFPPQAEGVSIGNPSFGQTNDNYLIYDKIDFNNSVDEIWAVNLFTGESNLIENNGSSIGFPRYSTNDEKIVFQRIDENNKSNLRQIDLAENKISSNTQSVNYVSGGQLPIWFSIGNRPVSVEKNKTTAVFKLYQNYPNPFNPVTTIKYTIANTKKLNATSQPVQLKVYNVLGKEVAILVNSKQSPGNYEVSFDASNLTSGIYIYQLTSGGNTQIRKMVLLK